MNKIYKLLFISIMLFSMASCDASGPREKNIYVLLETTAGDIKVMLYNETPLHRDNFIELVNSGIYNGVIFHRVINAFMVQTGDISTKKGTLPINIDSLSSYTIPSEFVSSYYHKKGALAAARQGNNINPDMRSSGTQFYIVQGSVWTENKLDQFERSINSNIQQSIFNMFMYQVNDSTNNAEIPLSSPEIQEIASEKMFNYMAINGEYKMTKEQREDYKTIGGYPSLDGTYTVFGEVVEGLEIIDRIASVPTNSNDKPLEDIEIIEVKIVKK